MNNTMLMHELHAPTRRGSVCPSSPRQAHNIFTKSQPHALHLQAPKHGPCTLTARCPAPRYISVKSPAPPYVPQLPSISSAMWMRHLIVTMMLAHPNTTLCTIETNHVPEQQQMHKSNQNTHHKLYAPTNRGSVCPLARCPAPRHISVRSPAPQLRPTTPLHFLHDVDAPSDCYDGACASQHHALHN